MREVGKVAAPIDAPGVRFQPGTTVRVDAVVRTRKIGHFFPGGTVDAYDVWLEFQARDARGRILAWSGGVEDNGRGPVDPGAHFYRSYQLDGEGNPINKRNAWQTRSVLYVRLIPPGAADTVHFRMAIPKDAAGPITLEAKLNYRKFSNYYTKFAFAGVAKAGQRAWITTAASIRSTRSRFRICRSSRWRTRLRTIAVGRAELAAGDSQADRERWNDWGIGLLLQGDLKGAEYAFHRVTEAEPGYADGWLNVARALIQEGETDAARPFIEKALALEPGLARAIFLPGHDAEGGWRLRRRDSKPAARRHGNIRATAWC